MPRFKRLQKFSHPLVWTSPRTYSTAWSTASCWNSSALQDAHDGGLIRATSSRSFPPALALVHIARFPTDEGLLRFDLAGQFVDAAHAEGVPDAVVHEPRDFVRDADGPVNFVGRSAVFSVRIPAELP